MKHICTCICTHTHKFNLEWKTLIMISWVSESDIGNLETKQRHNSGWIILQLIQKHLKQKQNHTKCTFILKAIKTLENEMNIATQNSANPNWLYSKLELTDCIQLDCIQNNPKFF